MQRRPQFRQTPSDRRRNGSLREGGMQAFAGVRIDA
jgi:hypothetical protein